MPWLSFAIGTLCLLLVALAGWRQEADAAALALAIMGIALWALRPREEPRAEAVPGERDTDDGEWRLLSALPDPVVVVDARSLVIAANRAALAVAPGLRPGHPLSFSLRAPQLLEAIPRVVQTGEIATVEFGGRVAAEPTYEVRLAPTRGATDVEAPMVLLAFRDLTAERRSERMRVDFVANVSHELRTPLASILGFVETLQGPARDDPAARDRFLAIMRGQANRMKGLIDDLLHLSRVELRAHLPPAGIIDVGMTVAHMVEIMMPLARERGVELQLDLPPEPVEMVADRDEVLRLVENLVANAIKYGGAGGSVHVAVRRTEDVVELIVRDRGPGIAPEHLPRLTERFYRVDVAESRVQGGTGLGLAIVKHIVTRHRGRLSIASEPGLGATFTIRLPIGNRHPTVTSGS